MTKRDAFWDRLMKTYRKANGFAPLSDAEAQAAYDAAPEVLIPAGRIREIVAYATKAREGEKEG